MTLDVKVLRKEYCGVGEAFLGPSRRSRRRDSSLPPSESFLFHFLAFCSDEAFSEGMLEPLALCMCGILDSSRV